MKLLFLDVTVDFLLASSAPLTQRERQPGTGRWTEVIQNMAEVTVKTDITVNNTKTEGENDCKNLLSALNNTIEIFKSLGSAYVKIVAPRNTSPPGWLTQ